MADKINIDDILSGSSSPLFPQITDKAIWATVQNEKLTSQRWNLDLGRRKLVNGTGDVYLSKIPPSQTADNDPREGSNASQSPNVQPPSDANPSASGFIQMPPNGPGWLRNPGTTENGDWGEPAMIRAVIQIATDWFNANQSKLVIGDMSRKDGGVFLPHQGHRSGHEVDIRPIGKNGSQQTDVVNINYSNYDRDGTLRLISLILNNSVLPVEKIFFNDPVVIATYKDRVFYLEGHDNHIHTTFKRT